MRQKSDSFRVWLTSEENDSFKKLAEQHSESRSKIALRLIREAINQYLDILTDERLLISVFIRQLSGIVNNLNHVTRAINTGTSLPSLYINLLYEIKKSMLAVRLVILMMARESVMLCKSCYQRHLELIRYCDESCKRVFGK